MLAKSEKNLSDFGRWLRRYEFSCERAGEVLHLSRQMVSFLSKGETLPGILTAYDIENWTRSVNAADYISMQSWGVQETITRRLKLVR